MLDRMPARWSCSYRARSGARANATFDSAEQAKRFAESHAALGGSAEWAEAEEGWVLRLVAAEYVVKPA
jgi:hypothetical protein